MNEITIIRRVEQRVVILCGKGALRFGAAEDFPQPFNRPRWRVQPFSTLQIRSVDHTTEEYYLLTYAKLQGMAFGHLKTKGVIIESISKTHKILHNSWSS